MNTILRSKETEVQINPLGAELVSFITKGQEYMWSGDAAFWTGRSPVLFPIVGAARNGQIKVDGTLYTIGNHGFARRSLFTLLEADDTRAAFRLTDNETTRTSYPFSFSLDLIYTLDGQSLKIEYVVRNTGDRDMPFQLGTHPAFLCPLHGEGSLPDYFLEFDRPEQLERLFLNESGLIIEGKAEPLALVNGRLPLNHEMFYGDALVFRSIASRRITLRGDSSDSRVAVSFENFPDLGIWQRKDAPFLCIEPWHGIADGEHFTGELGEKTNAVTLAPGAQFTASLTIDAGA